MTAALRADIELGQSEHSVMSPIADKSDIAREFGAASATYEGASRLQRIMGNAMIETLADEVYDDARILDLGCGTGWFTRKLSGFASNGGVTGVDLSAGMIELARQHQDNLQGRELSWLVADAENLPLPDHSFDIVFSNLMIQWCADPLNVLRECRRLLKPGGRLMVSTLVEGTLKELKQAWAVADPLQSHVNRFEPESRLKGLVARELPGAELVRKTITLPYDSPLSLAGELKRLGAGYKGEARRRTLTGPGRVRAMCKAYPTQPDGSVLASYEAAWLYWQA